MKGQHPHFPISSIQELQPARKPMQMAFTDAHISPNAKLHMSLSLHNDLSTPHASTTKTTIYFGYGSNLWREQMRRRCPTSEYLGIARLKGYRWIIYDRGYANIVQVPAEELTHRDEPPTQTEHDYAHEVWGLVYRLQPRDEERLDRNEGVPVAYAKEMIDGLDFWPAPACVQDPPQKQCAMLVYLNRASVLPSIPKAEYVGRMNKAIADAVREGIPEAYVDQCLRPYIPPSLK